MCEDPNKLSFNKGHTAAGYAENVFHIHIQELGNCDELYFRDYLNEHASRAKAYEKLKLQLWEKYKPNRDLYTLGKSEFVAETVKAAKEIYKGRY